MTHMTSALLMQFLLLIGSITPKNIIPTCVELVCRVLDQQLLEDSGKSTQWTISKYLKSVFAANSHFKLAVALFEVHTL